MIYFSYFQSYSFSPSSLLEVLKLKAGCHLVNNMPSVVADSEAWGCIVRNTIIPVIVM